MYELVKTWEYRDMRDEMLRDLLVVGIKDKEISEKLHLNAGLTLEIVKKKIRQVEAVHEHHVHLLDGSRDNPIVMEGVHSTTKLQGQPAGASQYKPQSARANPASYKPHPGRANQCTRGGDHAHSATERCPARGAMCHRCNRRGQYQSQCFSKTVVSCSTSEFSLNMAFVGSLDTKLAMSWTTTLTIEE